MQIIEGIDGEGLATAVLEISAKDESLSDATFKLLIESYDPLEPID